jgi:tetratricopeptide (TPR) repeat protein
MRSTRTLGLTLGLLAACSSTPTTTNTAANVARDSSGNTVTSATGQAVSASANERFNTAAAAMRTHDAANNGLGDWTPESCNEVAGLFERAAQEQNNGQFAEAWFNRGMVFDRCNLANESRQAFDRALQISNGNYCRAKVQLGVQAFRRREVPQAQQMFEEAIRQDPTHCVEGYTNLAMVLRSRNPSTEQEWAGVIRNIRAALALDDRYLPARNELALAYLQQAGDDPNSQRVFLAGLVCAQAIQVAEARAQEIDPQVSSFVADIHNTWGLVDIRRGEIIRALGHFRRASQLNPSMFEAFINYGTINLSFRGYDDARQAFEAAVRLRDDSYDAHLGLGVALRGLSQTQANDTDKQAMIQRAQQEYARAQQLDQNRPDSYYNQGLLNMSYMGNTIPDLRRAQELLTQFQQRAGQQPRYAQDVQRATRHINNIRQTIAALEAVGGTTPTPAAPAGDAPAAPAATPAPAAAPAPAATPAPAAAPAAGATP